MFRKWHSISEKKLKICHLIYFHNHLQMLLQLLGGFGGMGNQNGNNQLMEFLITQLSPEQQQLFEQLRGFTNETGNDEEQQ